MSAAAPPRATVSAATLIDAAGLRRSAADGDSSIDTTSGASTIRTRARSTSGCRASSASIVADGPTSVTPRSKWRTAANAPSTTWRGAKSPPIASTAIWIMEQALFFVDRAYLAPAVVPAVDTHTMRLLGFVAVRALGQTDRLQRIVRPALGRPRLRMSSLGIGHRFVPDS